MLRGPLHQLFAAFTKTSICFPRGHSSSRWLHVTHSLLAKVFQDRENMHAHAVLQQSPKSYQIFSVIAKPDVDFYTPVEKVDFPPESANSEEIFNSFLATCRYCAQTNTLISQQQFRQFVQQFCDITHKLSDDQLKASLWALAQLPAEQNVRAPNFVELWNNLDIECCRRIEKWKTDELLLLCDAWYNLNMAKVCDFVWEALRKLGRKVAKMQPEQLVQTMFLCNVIRRSLFDMFDFEVNLAKICEQLNIFELGVMSMGFFKTQTQIRNPDLIKYLYDRVMAEMHVMDDITFVAILKVLRYSSKLPQVNLMISLLDKINKEKVDHLNILTALHVALLGCDLQVSNDELLQKIITKFHNELENTRLKDLERICSAMAIFNIRTPSKIEDALCLKIIESLHERMTEILKYPKCFTNCLHYLSLRGFYDVEMLSSALEKKFLSHAVGSNLAASRELFHLDTFVKVNLKSTPYEGAQLPEKYRKTMGKLLTQYIPERNSKYKLNVTDSILLQIKEISQELLQNARLMHILPNYDRADVVICFDRSQRKAIKVADSCAEDYSGVILTRDQLLGESKESSIDTVAVVVVGWNNVVRGKNRFTGLFDMKLEQLQLLGHKPVTIYWHEWRELETHRDRVDFVKRRLASVINL